MLRQGPVPLTVHALTEPLFAALLVAAPFLFGFHDRGAPTAVCILAGIAVLLVAMSTCWRVSLVKLIPIPAHLMIDLGTAALLVASPFLFGFSDHTGATTFFIVAGVGELLYALATRWYPERAPGGPRRPRRARGPETPARPA